MIRKEKSLNFMIIAPFTKQEWNSNSYQSHLEFIFHISVRMSTQESCDWVSRSVWWWEQVTELIVLNLAGAVLVNVLDELFNINGHLKLFFDDTNQLLSVDRPITVFLASHRHERIQSVLFIACWLVLFLLRYDMPELRVRDLASALGICFRNHSENFLLSRLLSHHF